MSWYEQWFDRDEYELLYRERDEQEAEAALDMILDVTTMPPGARVLDVGCGRGRHAIALARRGYHVTGLDLSERALARARTVAAESGVDVAFVHGDMRQVVAEGTFDLVVNLFTAFGYFEEPSSHQQAVDAMAAALRPNGCLVQDFLNPGWVREHLVPEDHRKVADLDLRQRRWIEDGRIKKQIVFRRGANSHEFMESVALLERGDFERMYNVAGLALFDVRGDYEGGPWTPKSPRSVYFGRRS